MLYGTIDSCLKYAVAKDIGQAIREHNRTLWQLVWNLRVLTKLSRDLHSVYELLTLKSDIYVVLHKRSRAFKASCKHCASQACKSA